METGGKVNITFSERLRHKGSVDHCPQIKGAEREQIRKTLQGSDPSRLLHRLLSSISGKMDASGNRDGVASQQVLQKILSERNLCGRPFVDTVQSLVHFRACFIMEDKELYPEHVKRSLDPTFLGTSRQSLFIPLSSLCGQRLTCACIWKCPRRAWFSLTPLTKLRRRFPRYWAHSLLFFGCLSSNLW